MRKRQFRKKETIPHSDITCFRGEPSHNSLSLSPLPCGLVTRRESLSYITAIAVVLLLLLLSRFDCVRLFATLWIDRNSTGSSVHGILQARILARIAVPSSRESSRPRDQTRMSSVSCFGRQVIYHQCHLGSPMWSQEIFFFFFLICPVFPLINAPLPLEQAVHVEQTLILGSRNCLHRISVIGSGMDM